ncbi:glgA [Acrasis kona]|uniref:GlgA n=1 Tax=Acrasis kona TaxID=1008807 RepID=A0AAW2Z3Y7_9EUKA
MGEILFTLHNNAVDNSSVGSVYFGYKIDTHALPFSVVAYAGSTGFLMVRDVYRVLDLIIHQCQVHNTHITNARLVKDNDDPCIRSYMISRSYGALCGINLCWCCFSQSRVMPGKISEEQYRDLTLDSTNQYGMV